MKQTCVSIFLHADDILLLAPTLTALQQLLLICETEIESLDMKINAKKSYCIRIGPRYNASCDTICTTAGSLISWCDEIRYLGVYIVSARAFSCSFNHAKESFYRAFNAIFGKVGRVASEDVIVQLINAKCMPCLLYTSPSPRD